MGEHPVAPVFSHGVAVELNAVGAMDEPVKDGVGHGGIPDKFMPPGGWELAGDERGSREMAVVEDLQKVPVQGGVGFFEPKVVNDQEINLRQLFQEGW